MSSIKVNCGNIEISNDNKICIIAGPCQLETEQHAMDMAGKIQEITNKFNLGFIYKTSFDKANRTSIKGKRGAGLETSLPIFDKIKKELNIPVLTDIHNVEQCSIDYVGISSDFGGGGGIEGWSNASQTFNITNSLLLRGYFFIYYYI